MRIKQVVNWYLNSWWAPGTIYFGFLGLALASTMGVGRSVRYSLLQDACLALTLLFILCAFVALVGVLVVGIVALRRKNGEQSTQLVLFLLGGFLGWFFLGVIGAVTYFAAR